MSHVEELVWKLLRQTRILLVEARPGSLAGLAATLENLYECEIERAATAYDVHSFLAVKEFGVVFVASDVGIAFTEVLHAVKETRPTTPVVLVREPKGVYPLELFTEAGFFGVMQAPFTADTLHQVFGAFRIAARSRLGATDVTVGTPSLRFSPA